jgi:hypothetical protein
MNGIFGEIVFFFVFLQENRIITVLLNECAFLKFSFLNVKSISIQSNIKMFLFLFFSVSGEEKSTPAVLGRSGV